MPNTPAPSRPDADDRTRDEPVTGVHELDTAVARPLRLLVAEDDPDQRALLGTILGLHLPSAVVRLCGGGDEALDELRGAPISVALLDLAMPEPSGIALVNEIRARSPSTAIVILTGVGSGAERTSAKALGVRRFLVKPYEIDELLRAIRLALGDAERDALVRAQ